MAVGNRQATDPPIQGAIQRRPVSTPRRGQHLARVLVSRAQRFVEELLFRGFLLTALSATALGYWRAAVIATLAWTALHFSYSWVGLTEVFVIGLYLSWLLWRTGSLLPPLFCHALYNSCLLVALRFWPQ